jgi:hypothetical protein
MSRQKQVLSKSDILVGRKITKKVEDYIEEVSSKPKFAKLIKISRGTLNTRLEKHNWTETEKFLLQERNII